MTYAYTEVTRVSDHESHAAVKGNTSEVVAATARRLGATSLFILMGGTNMRVVHAFSEAGVALHHFRHENAAIGAADGYARSTGNIGWSSVIHGPGLTNAMTALRTAVKARSPQVLVMADTMSTAPRNSPFESGVQGLSPEAMLVPIGIPVVRVSAETAAADTVSAYHTARRELSPVALLIPYGVEAEHSTADIDAALVGHVPPPSAVVPALADIDAAEHAIRGSRQIVLLAGRGASDPETAALLRRLSDLTGAYIGTSVRGIGAFNGAPNNLGLVGGFTNDAGVEVINGSDLFLAFGVSLNYLQTRRSSYLADTVVVHVDEDKRAIGRYDRVDVPVHGDATLVARALVERFEVRAIDPARPLPTAPGRDPFVDVSTPNQLDPRAVATTLDRVLPSERAVVVDGGHFAVWPIYFMQHSGPDTMHWACDFGAMGSSLGPGLGAAIGRPDRLTAVFIGDCGLFMTLGDVEVAMREQIPLLIVCFNDGAAGSELVLANIAKLPPDEAVFGVADLAKIVRAIGVDAAAIETIDQLEAAIASWDRQGPLFLDCRITRDVKSPLYAQYA